MELLNSQQDLIGDRYRILEILGQGGVGITYAAEDLQTSQRVALKALSLRRLQNWKAIELFEREARILSQLNHPAIPRYLDYFEIDAPQNRSFYLVQQLAEGESLATLIENGWYPEEEEVIDIARQVLEILVYLHQLTPPVIHRDIKPQNIIRGDDGKIFLVDFGAVQDTYHNTVSGGSTVVGTYGYMAPEQFRGQAILSTDLYGLGTTLLFLLTGKCPADLPQRQLEIQFRDRVRISRRLADWLERILAPVAEDRFVAAEEALAVLDGRKAIPKKHSFKSRKPKRNRKPNEAPIFLHRTEAEIVIKIPRVGLRNYYNYIWSLLPFIWNGFWLLVFYWLILEYQNVLGANFIAFLLLPFALLGLQLLPERFQMIRLFIITILGMIYIPIFFIHFLNVFIISSLFIFGMWMPGSFLFSGAFPTTIKIDRQKFYLKRGWLGWWGKKIEGAIENLQGVKVIRMTMPFKKEPLSCCEVKLKQDDYLFGLFLTPEENDWLAKEIQVFLSSQ